MGVTIHFQGRLIDERMFDRVVEIATSYARELGWAIEPINSGEVKLLRVRPETEEEWDYVGPVTGIAIYPGENSEPVRLEFDKDLYLQEYTKTQFAGPALHIQVIELLRRIELCFEKLLVEDEGEYWETSDPVALKTHMDWCNRVISEELRKDPKAVSMVRLPSGRLIDLMR